MNSFEQSLFCKLCNFFRIYSPKQNVWDIGINKCMLFVSCSLKRLCQCSFGVSVPPKPHQHWVLYYSFAFSNLRYLEPWRISALLAQGLSLSASTASFENVNKTNFLGWGLHEIVQEKQLAQGLMHRMQAANVYSMSLHRDSEVPQSSHFAFSLYCC